MYQIRRNASPSFASIVRTETGIRTYTFPLYVLTCFRNRQNTIEISQTSVGQIKTLLFRCQVDAQQQYVDVPQDSKHPLRRHRLFCAIH